MTVLIQRILPALLTSLPNLHTPQYVNKGKGRSTISPFEGILSQAQRCQNNKRNVDSSAMMSLWPHFELVGDGPSGKFCTFMFSFLDDLGWGGGRERERERQRDRDRERERQRQTFISFFLDDQRDRETDRQTETQKEKGRGPGGGGGKGGVLWS